MGQENHDRASGAAASGAIADALFAQGKRMKAYVGI
jgi:hypothetical protein